MEQFRQYRFARTHGQKIIEAEFAIQFKDSINDISSDIKNCKDSKVA